MEDLIDLFLSLSLSHSLLYFIFFLRIHTHPIQRNSKWVRKPRRKILWKYVSHCVSWQVRSMLDKSQTEMYWAQRTNNIYNVCQYLKYAILAMSLLSIIKISSLFMPKKHLVGLDTIHIFFSSHAHMHIFTWGSMIFKNTDGGKIFFLCFLTMWEFCSLVCAVYWIIKKKKILILALMRIYFGTRQAN